MNLRVILSRGQGLVPEGVPVCHAIKNRAARRTQGRPAARAPGLRVGNGRCAVGTGYPCHGSPFSGTPFSRVWRSGQAGHVHSRAEGVSEPTCSPRATVSPGRLRAPGVPRGCPANCTGNGRKIGQKIQPGSGECWAARDPRGDPAGAAAPGPAWNVRTRGVPGCVFPGPAGCAHRALAAVRVSPVAARKQNPGRAVPRPAPPGEVHSGPPPFSLFFCALTAFSGHRAGPRPGTVFAHGLRHIS